VSLKVLKRAAILGLYPPSDKAARFLGISKVGCSELLTDILVNIIGSSKALTGVTGEA